MKNETKHPQENKGKRAYRRPKLKRYGKVSKITKGGGSHNDDGFDFLLPD